MIIFSVLILGHEASAESIDTDGDMISNDDEIAIYHTDPNKADTDGDGFLDGEEIKSGFSPLNGKKTQLRQVDTDKDGLWDDWEIAIGTDLANSDTDSDGFSDGLEVKAGHNPLSSDTALISKRIEVTLKEQRLTYYFGDIKLDTFLISSGLRVTPTPVGSFTIIKKRPTVHYQVPGYDFPNTKWNLMFKQGKGLNYYIHGAYWHNQFGRPKSHGCVNVPYKPEVMGRLYDWADVGTPVIIQ